MTEDDLSNIFDEKIRHGPDPGRCDTGSRYLVGKEDIVGNTPMQVVPKAEAFIWAAKRAFQLGLQASTGGNISIRLGTHRFLTKPTGRSLAVCSATDLIVVDEKGEIIQGQSRPTKEIQVHLSLFAARQSINAVVHYHAPYATAYACKGVLFPLLTLHARRTLNTIPVLPEYAEGSPELAKAAAGACADENVQGLLMINHGMIALGKTIEEAQYRAELMEESAKIGWLAQSIP